MLLFLLLAGHAAIGIELKLNLTGILFTTTSINSATAVNM